MISIVMPAFNRAATLPRAIDSVLRQTYSDWELIIVDDASTDETAAVLDRYDDPRIRVYRHEHNRGVAAAKNTGFDHMAGEWFVIFDSDDEIVPDALATLLDTAVQTGAAAITCNCVSARTGRLTGLGWDTDGWKSEADAARLTGEHWGMQKASLLDGQRFDERLPGMEGILWTKLAHAAGRRYYIHAALRVYHTEGAGGVSTAPRSRFERIATDRAIGDDTAYLDILRATNPDKYRRVVRRVWRAKVMSAIVRGRVSSSRRRDASV